MHEARVRARARALPPAFLEEIARPDLDAKTTHAAIAGLIVLRMVDRWVAGGCRPVDVTGARKAVEEMDAGNPAKAVLNQVLGAIAAEGDASPEAVTENLLTYAQILDREARWTLAVAVYDAIVGYAGVPSSPQQVFTSLIRKALSLRTLGTIEEATKATDSARSMAESSGDPAWHVQVQLSYAMHALDQGQLKHADEIIVKACERAPADLPPYLRARLLNGRGAVAGVDGDFERAIVYCSSALECDPEPNERDRILHNIGEAFRLLGYPEASRDAFLILSCTSEERLVQWAAFVALMLLAAEAGDREHFDEHRRRLESADIPPWLRVDFLQHLSLGLTILGDENGARDAGTMASTLAAQYGLGIERFKAKRADPPKSRGPGSSAAPSELDDIAVTLKALRESTVAG